MARDPQFGPAQNKPDGTQAASGGRVGIGHPTYAEVALKLFDNGYEPLPLRAGDKAPLRRRHGRQITIDEAQVRRWVRTFPNAGVGLRTGNLVGIDIDVLDPDLAHQMGQIVEDRIGATPMRVGRWPKRLYLARTNVPFAEADDPQTGNPRLRAAIRGLRGPSGHPETLLLGDGRDTAGRAAV